MSAWVNDALQLKADHDRRLQALDDFLAAYEVEHGEITDQEMRDAARRTVAGRWWCGARQRRGPRPDTAGPECCLARSGRMSAA